jgi:hypothetical protein
LKGDGIRISTFFLALLALTTLAGSPGCCWFITLNGKELGIGDGGGSCSTGTAQHSTAQHSTAQHSTAQHSTAQHTSCLSILFIQAMMSRDIQDESKQVLISWQARHTA